MKATILLATCRRPKSCLKTIDNILLNDRNKLVENIIIIENGEQTNLRELIQSSSSYSNVKYLFSSPANKSIALNLGLKHLAPETFIIFFDDDISIFPETIESYVFTAKKFGSNYYYGGPTYSTYEETPKKWILELLPASVKGLELNSESEFSKKDLFFLGFNWAAFKSSIDLTKGFNENFGPGSLTGSTGQESNMMRQLNSNEIFGLYVPLARVKHHVSKNVLKTRWIMNRKYRHAVETGLTIHKSTFVWTLLNPRHYFPIIKALLRPELDFKAKYVRTLAMAADRAGILRGLYLKKTKFKISDKKS